MEFKIYHETPFGRSLIMVLTEKQYRVIFGLLGTTVGLSVILIYHFYKMKKQRAVIKNVDRGGEEFKDFIDPGLMYEIKDESLAKAIIKMIKLTPGNGPLVIDARIAIKAILSLEEYLNSKVAYRLGFSFLARKALQMASKVDNNEMVKSLVTMFGLMLSSHEVQVVAPAMGVVRRTLNEVVPFIVGLGGGVGGYAWLVPLLIANPNLPVTLLLSALISLGGFTATNRGTTNYLDRVDRAVFNEIVRTIPPIKINNDITDTVFLLPEPSEKSTGIYIRSEQGEKKALPASVDVNLDADFEILMNSGNKVQPTCTISEQSKSMLSLSSEEKIIECEVPKTKAVPLKFRTKTWAELVEEGIEQDNVETEELFSAYNRKSNEYRRRREKIMAERNLDRDRDTHELNVNDDKQTSTFSYTSIEELEKDMNQWE